MEQSIKRLNFIDVAKGIGIILVVLGHCLAYENQNKLFMMIYSFHMPFFFFLSGFLFKDKSYETYLSGKLKTLLFPMIFFQALNIISYGFLFLLGFEKHHDTIAFGGFWFLGTLLYVSCLYYMLSEKFFSNFRRRNVIVLTSASIAMIFGLIYAKRISDQPNQLIATSFVAFSFYALGHICNTNQSLQNLVLQSSKPMRVFFAIGSIALFILLAYLVGFTNRNVDMNTSRYGNSLFFILNALVGISAAFLASVAISKNHILEFFGKNSLMIFLLHIPLWKTFDFIVKKILNIPSVSCRIFLVFLASITISTVLAIIINRHFTWLKGQIKFNK